MLKYKVITHPNSEPLSLPTVKEWLKVDFDADDALISALITGSRQSVEKYTQLILLSTVIEQAYDQFSIITQSNPYAEMTLAWSPVVSVESVQYYDSNGTLTTLDSSRYIVDDYSKPSNITPAYNHIWPEVQTRKNAVIVRYTCGYANSDDIPQAIKTAMLLTIADAYEKRQDSVKKLPSQSEWILDKYRVQWF